jgi:hypothetical protein
MSTTADRASRRPRRLVALLSLLLPVLLAGWTGAAMALPEAFVDKQDQQLDISEWLVEQKGFLPIPIIITEPAIGYGGGLAAMFLRNSMRESAEKARETGLLVPPDIWVVGAFGTENGTKGAFGGGMMTFDEGKWKYRGGVARVDINLAFYGIGDSPLGGATGIDYSLDGWASSQQILRRLGPSNNWLGLRWIYLNLNSKLDISGNPAAGLDRSQASKKASGLGLTLEHDSRDNIFTPSSGLKAGLDGMFYDPSLGSDTAFQTYRGHVFAYWPLHKDFVLGGRLDSRAANGKVPFYMLPFVDMRGVPVARYQDERTALVETELRWTITPRWAAVGFVGSGRAWGSKTSFDEASSVLSKGAGFRYLIARQLGLWVGVDYARGPEEGAVYIMVGNAWR